MTPTVLAINLGLSVAAFSALCLSQNRHHAAAFDAKPGRWRVVLLRAAGWVCIALSLVVAGNREGWAFGPVQWLGALTGAAACIVLLLAYVPTALSRVGVAALVACAAATLFA